MALTLHKIGFSRDAQEGTGMLTQGRGKFYRDTLFPKVTLLLASETILQTILEMMKRVSVRPST